MNLCRWVWDPRSNSWFATDGLGDAVFVSTPGGMLQPPMHDPTILLLEKKLFRTKPHISEPQMKAHGIISDREGWTK